MVKFKTVTRTILITLMSAYVVNAYAYDIDPKIEACIKKNAPKATSIQRIKLASQRGEYDEEEMLSAKVYWKLYPAGTSNLLAVFSEPVDIYGSRLLFLEKKSGNDIYMYMPALSMVRRITSDRIASSMYGMDFSYEDFQWMYNMLSTAASEQRPDAVINGEPAYVFAIIPDQKDGSMYEKIFSYFDKKSCVIQKVEFYQEGGDLHKVLVTEPGSIKKVNGMLVPHKFLMRDEKNGTETSLEVISASVDPVIKDSFFDPAKLKEHRGVD